jgi:hypothetical protein
MENGSLRADLLIVELSDHQQRAVDAGGGLLSIVGPPGSGKTAALAARSRRLAAGGSVAVICSHESSCAAFRQALGGQNVRDIDVDTLAGHLAQWMRAQFASSGVAPDLAVGSEADSRAIVRIAARGLLDVSWPQLRTGAFNLDLPFLSRPDMFLDEASSLFRLLRRGGVGADDFEAACVSGLWEFYGDGVERARALCADPVVRSRASKRGRDALLASADELMVQKSAERDLGALLAQLYREYLTVARGARVLSPEDVIDEGLAWLQRDGQACARIAASLASLVIDDAEDAEPGTGVLVDLLTGAGLSDVAVAGWKDSAIDGIGGRRPLIPSVPSTRVELPPRPVPAEGKAAHRAPDDGAEADRLATAIGELLANGVAPDDIVLLARDDDGANVYAALLADRGVPITVTPAAWQSPHEIADILALACVVDDPYDRAHLLRVLASPMVGLNDLSLWTLCRDASASAQLSLEMGGTEFARQREGYPAPTTLSDNALFGTADRALGTEGRQALAVFRSTWERWRRECAGLGPAAALAYLIDAAGFRTAWRRTAQHLQARLEDDALRLIAAAGQYAAALPGAGLCRFARAVEEGSCFVRPAKDVSGAVACRTIVGAKGMRRPYVFVAGIAHERFPRIYVSRALAFSKKYGLIVRENVAGPAAQSAKFAWYYGKFGAKARYLEEEMRALYYGLLRADRAAQATGYGKPPRWASDHDLLAPFGV